MKQSEKDAISAGLLVHAQSTEMLMRAWLNMTQSELRGEQKQLFNNMKASVRSAHFYYDMFCSKFINHLVKGDKSWRGASQMLRDAGDLIRLYLTIVNLSANGYDNEGIINALNRLLEQEENPTILISKDDIDKFKVK